MDVLRAQHPGDLDIVKTDMGGRGSRRRPLLKAPRENNRFGLV